MPYLPKSAPRPWIPQAPKREYVPHAARTADYDSPEWKALRKQQLQRQPACVECGASGKWMVADHITPARLGGEFYSLANLQTLCRRCHQRKSASERLKTAATPPGGG